MFSSVEINSKVIETVAQNCSLKKDLLKFFKICKKIPRLETRFFKIRLKEKKGNSSTDVFPRIVLIFFRTLLLKVAIQWLLLKVLSRLTHQNLVSFQGKHLSRSFVIRYLLALRFPLILLISLKLIMILTKNLQTFDSGLFSI